MWIESKQIFYQASRTLRATVPKTLSPMADLRQRKKVVPEGTFDGLKAGLAKVSQRLTPQ